MTHEFGLDAIKSVFGISDKARLNPVSSATETSFKIETSPVASLDMVPSNKRIAPKFLEMTPKYSPIL